MVLKRFKSNAIIGNNYRVQIGGGIGTEHVSISHHSLKHTMYGPGVAQYDFTYKGGEILLKWYTSTGFFAYLSTLYWNGSTWIVDMPAQGPDSPNSFVLDRTDKIVTPTYFETLDKLDQHSTAQYTPKSSI